MEGIFVPLHVQVHSPEIVVGEQIVGRKSYRAFQDFTSRRKLVFRPSEKSEVAISIFEKRIEADGFLIFSGSRGSPAHADEQDAAKITHPRVVWVFAFRSVEIFQGILKTIVLESRKALLKCIFRPGHLTGVCLERMRADIGRGAIETEKENRKVSHAIDLRPIL